MPSASLSENKVDVEKRHPSFRCEGIEFLFARFILITRMSDLMDF